MSTGKYKLSNGVLVEMTQTEIDEQTKSNTEIFNEAMENLRSKRDRLLADTDYIVIKNLEAGTSIPAAWTTYRTNLRDLTNGLTTVDQVKAVEFPTKPE
jgi:hypothetical protein